jgi:hypothetical protein
MRIDESYVAVLLSSALVNVLILVVWGLARILPRGCLRWLAACLARLSRRGAPQR